MKKEFGWFALPLSLMLGFAHAQPGEVTYVYTDPQGTPLVEADANGNIMQPLTTSLMEARPWAVLPPALDIRGM